jgi:hypothetical protein
MSTSRPRRTPRLSVSACILVLTLTASASASQGPDTIRLTSEGQAAAKAVVLTKADSMDRTRFVYHRYEPIRTTADWLNQASGGGGNRTHVHGRDGKVSPSSACARSRPAPLHRLVGPGQRSFVVSRGSASTLRHGTKPPDEAIPSSGAPKGPSLV